MADHTANTNMALGERIHEAYRRDRHKPELLALLALLTLVRTSRKYGFPVVCTTVDQGWTASMRWATRLLLATSGSGSVIDVPDDFFPQQHSELYADAAAIVENTRGNTERLALSRAVEA